MSIVYAFLGLVVPRVSLATIALGKLGRRDAAMMISRFANTMTGGASLHALVFVCRPAVRALEILFNTWVVSKLYIPKEESVHGHTGLVLPQKHKPHHLYIRRGNFPGPNIHSASRYRRVTARHQKHPSGRNAHDVDHDSHLL